MHCIMAFLAGLGGCLLYYLNSQLLSIFRSVTHQSLTTHFSLHSEHFDRIPSQTKPVFHQQPKCPQILVEIHTAARIARKYLPKNHFHPGIPRSSSLKAHFLALEVRATNLVSHRLRPDVLIASMTRRGLRPEVRTASLVTHRRRPEALSMRVKRHRRDHTHPLPSAAQTPLLLRPVRTPLLD